MSRISESDHRRLEAIIFPDHCVVESHQVSDASRGLRRLPVTKVWRTERLLGRGGCGEVHLQSQESDKNDKRALKIVPTTTGVKLRLTDYQRELTALIEFTKPKYKDAAVFVDFFGWFQNDNAMFLAMEYMPLGDLEYNIQGIESSPTHTGPALSEREVQEITRQILEGLNIMHAEGFAHRDLKPQVQNVFVVQKHPQWWVKLGDFGLAKKQTDITAYRTQAGTQQYMAPELFYYVQELNTETSEYTTAIDLWSLGCIIYRVITGRVPFPSLLNLKNYCIDPSNMPLNIPPIMEEAREFVKGLLMPHPASRPLASAALESTWLTTKETSQVVLNDKQISFAALNISRSQNDYNTASHKGLQSLYTLETPKDSSIVPSASGPTSEPLPLPTSESISDPLTAPSQPRPQKDNEYFTAPIDYGTSTFRPASREEASRPSKHEFLSQPERSSITELETAPSDVALQPKPQEQASVLARQEERHSQSEPSIALQSHTTRREMAAQLLLQNGFDVMQRDLDKEAALHWAAGHGHEAAALLLLEKGADIEAKDNSGSTALRWAASEGHDAVVQLLLEKRADIEAKDNFGWTALRWAAIEGHDAVVQLLLENGANIEAKNNNGCTPLHNTAWRGHRTMVLLLLEKGADIEARDNVSRTALHWAAKFGERAVVGLLLEKGANIEAKDANRLTALRLAARERRKAVVKLLKEARPPLHERLISSILS